MFLIYRTRYYRTKAFILFFVQMNVDKTRGIILSSGINFLRFSGGKFPRKGLSEEGKHSEYFLNLFPVKKYSLNEQL